MNGLLALFPSGSSPSVEVGEGEVAYPLHRSIDAVAIYESGVSYGVRHCIQPRTIEKREVANLLAGEIASVAVMRCCFCAIRPIEVISIA